MGLPADLIDAQHLLLVLIVGQPRAVLVVLLPLLLQTTPELNIEFFLGQSPRSPGKPGLDRRLESEHGIGIIVDVGRRLIKDRPVEIVLQAPGRELLGLTEFAEKIILFEGRRLEGPDGDPWSSCSALARPRTATDSAPYFPRLRNRRNPGTPIAALKLKPRRENCGAGTAVRHL